MLVKYLQNLVRVLRSKKVKIFKIKKKFLFLHSIIARNCTQCQKVENDNKVEAGKTIGVL
jgi:hypothetical protein